jgi:hypothetical protein
MRPDPIHGQGRKPYSTCWLGFGPAAAAKTPVFPATWSRVPPLRRFPLLSVSPFSADLSYERSCRKGFRGLNHSGHEFQSGL